MHVYMYLQKVPSHEKCNILGCHWLSREWNPSRQLVCDSDESCFMSFRIHVFISMSFNLSYAFVPSLPVGVGVFLRRENLVFAFVAAILDNTRRRGAGRAVVDNKMAKQGEGAGGAKRNAYWRTYPR